MGGIDRKGIEPMRVAMTKPLFAWDSLEDSPSLQTVREFLRAVPDGKLLRSLVTARGRGRNEYPVHTLWGVLLLTPLLRHTTFEGCLGELRRNAGLRRLIGIEHESRVPRKWNISRFLEVLGTEPHWTLLQEVFDTMVQRLGEVVEDLGRHTAGDATGLSARPSRAEDQSELPEPSGGRREYPDEQGQVTHVVEWFGYKLHLLVDDHHEVSLAYRVSSAHDGDNEHLPALVAQGQANLPEDRMKTLAYDMACDAHEVHAALDDAGVVPIIRNRALWKEESERVLPGQNGDGNLVYDEAGTVYCYDMVSDPAVRHRMAYIGHEPARRTLKYRCPAMHEGWRCASHSVCNTGRHYGRTVRVKRDIDLRRFPPIPRATKKFERLYKGRTAVERINARLKIFWGADDGNISGAARFHAWVGTVMVVHIGLATLLASCPRREGTLGRMRLSPIAQALREKMAD
jgi:hypothetical protein